MDDPRRQLLRPSCADGRTQPAPLPGTAASLEANIRGSGDISGGAGTGAVSHSVMGSGEVKIGGQTLRQAHDIGAALRRAILAEYPQTDVIIHKDVAR